MFMISKYGESKKYVRLFRSKQEFCVYWEICEHRVDLLNKLLLLWCCVTCTHTELPQGPVHSGSVIKPTGMTEINPINPELNPICPLLGLLGTHHILHIGMIRFKVDNINLLTPNVNYSWRTAPLNL